MLGALASAALPASAAPGAGDKLSSKRPARLFFTSQGRTAIIHADGSGLRWFDFKKPEQVTWQPGPFLNVLLDVVDFPEQVAAEVEGWVGRELVPFLTGGFLKCELFHGDTTGLEAGVGLGAAATAPGG